MREALRESVKIERKMINKTRFMCLLKTHMFIKSDNKDIYLKICLCFLIYFML